MWTGTEVVGLAHTLRTGRLSFHAWRKKNIFAKNSFNVVRRLNKKGGLCCGAYRETYASLEQPLSLFNLSHGEFK